MVACLAIRLIEHTRTNGQGVSTNHWLGDGLLDRITSTN